jgi:hypothetical protein
MDTADELAEVENIVAQVVNEKRSRTQYTLKKKLEIIALVKARYAE